MAESPSWSDLIGLHSQAVTRFGAPYVRRMLRTGTWQQPHPRVVVLHNGPLTFRQRTWLAVLTGPPGSVIGGGTALELTGFTLFGQPTVHPLTLDRGRVTRLPAVHVHRTYLLPVHHVLALSPPRTVPARSVVDATAWATNDRQARALMLAAIRRKVAKPSEIRAALDVRLRQRRGRLMRETLLDAAAGIESLPELEFDTLLRRAGLPQPRRQRLLQRPDGRYYLDADYEEYGVSVEIDGAPHTDVGAGEADAEREHQLVIAGRRVLRFSAWMVRHRPAYVAAVVAAALRGGGWTGQPTTWVARIA